MSGQKWAEARALYQRATTYANKAKNDSLLSLAMKKEMQNLMQVIESKQFMAHANSILEAEGETSGVVGRSEQLKIDQEKSKIPLIDRLDDYYEDPELVSGKPNLVPFPPAFEPIPCKPLFFDLAREQVAFPSLEKKVAGPASPQGASGGWLGGWLGWGKKP
jgi:signal recognition particle subunit SRP68